MGTMPVPKVMLTMGVPIILSMVLQACYNIVDSIFVAGIPDSDGIVGAGEYAMNALTLAFPVQMMIVALAIGTGVGVNVVLSRALGKRDYEKVAKAAGNGVFLGLVIYLIFLLFGLFGIDCYLESQTHDPILIYGWLGFPAMGVAGAAWSTVIGQLVSMLVSGGLHYWKNKEVRSGIMYLKPKKRVILEIYQVGFPAVIMQALMSFMTYGVNLIFKAVSAGAVTAYGLFYKIQQFLFFVGFGLRDAITPIISFNYGMGDKKRVKQGVKYGLHSRLQKPWLLLPHSFSCPV